MKRSQLARKTPLSARKPMQKRRRKQSAAQKESRFRSPAYLAWVKSQPCVYCAQPADDPHHVIGLWQLSGMGLTAPDNFAVGLCRPHHDLVHREPSIQPAQADWLLWTLNKALTEQWPDETRAALLEAREFVIEKQEAE